VDSHHHLWDIPGWRYMLDDFFADIGSGHCVEASIYVQCYSMFRQGGDRNLRSLGETEFANGMAAIGASGRYGKSRICDGIVGYVNLALGAPVIGLLEQHVAAAGGRLKGVRHITAWSEDEAVQPKSLARVPPRDLMQSKPFLAGIACLEKLDLSFDAFVFHHQLTDIEALADLFPGMPIILNHMGGPVRIGRWAARSEEAFADWRSAMGRLSLKPNVYVKLGGVGMKINGFGLHEATAPPDSGQLADTWFPYIDYTIQTFGPSRCMFESNFPVDKGTCSYSVLWNAFKRITRNYSADERQQLFSGTATKVYRLQPSHQGTAS
jgi:predicted TIM-barrel fold metal-dependent hydrolase